MALVIADRVQQQGSANTTVSFTLSSGVTGYQSFSVIGNGNTTYYAATDASGNWEVGVGTYSTTGPTLTRTTIISSSNSGSAVSTFGNPVNVFVTYPSENAVYGNGTVLVAPSTAVLPVANGGTNASTAGITAFNNITGYTASGATGTTSTNLVFSTSPTLVTPTLGVATATSYTANGTITGSSNAGVFAYGTLGYSDVNHILTMASSQNNYIQMEIQNTNSGTAASADVIVSNNNTTATTYYGDFGINSSGFTGTGALGAANNVYLTATTGDLALGTTTANAIHLVINGSATDAMTINTSNAVAFNGAYGTSGQFLTSSGSGSAPTWTTPSSISQAKVTALVMTLGF